MLLETDKRLRVIGEAVQVEAAAEIIAEETPDIVLVDLPDVSDRDMFPQFQDINVPVLVLVSHYDVEIYQRCLKLGIRGLLLKEEHADTLFKAIEKIHGGEIWFDRTIMSKTILQLVNEKQFMNDFPKAHVTNALTEREKQVVELICKGKKNKGIADELFITETTVRHHLTSVFNKLEITSRLELVVYAFKNNLVSVPAGEPSYWSNSSGKGIGNGNGNGNGRHFTNGAPA
jgi:DNA-binding NarL/FixJ family response regulator